MSDFGEELTKLAVAENGKRETSVFSNPGMHFPWLQNRVETVGKWTASKPFALVQGSTEIEDRYEMNNEAR